MMYLRISIITGCSAFLACIAQGQTTQRLNIDEATVFINGAQLTSSARLQLAKGENEILFTNVAGDVNSQSLTVNASNGAVVESATFQNNYLATEILSPKAQEIKDSIELLWAYRGTVKNKIDALGEQIAVLQANRKVSGDNTGLSVTELMKMLDLVNSRMEATLNQKNKEEELLGKTDARVTKLKKQLDEEQKKAYQPGGQLLVKFYAKEAANTAVSISYVVPHAGWSPTYDIWADDAHSPVKLFYKANIHQNSGVSWPNVHLSLSTGNPTEGVQAPTMAPWYLAFYSPSAFRGNSYRAKGDYMGQAPAAMAKGLKQSAEDDNGRQLYQSSINDYVSVDNSGVNATFDIDLPYSIPSDGQQHLVAIKRYEVPATFRYYAVPKIDKDAFLQAEITNWEDLNLMSGPTNIFYEGTYVGQGSLDALNTKDTMVISLGRDKKIVVKREQDKKLRSVKTVGTNVRETFAYTISVRNARKEPINLVIQDQQPVSNDKDIVIEERETANAEYDEATGMMKWTLNIKPNETQSTSFGYTIKYPKGKIVANLR